MNPMLKQIKKVLIKIVIPKDKGCLIKINIVDNVNINEWISEDSLLKISIFEIKYKDSFPLMF